MEGSEQPAPEQADTPGAGDPRVSAQLDQSSPEINNADTEIAALQHRLAQEISQRQSLADQYEEERRSWCEERKELLKEMAEEAAERQSLLQQLTEATAKHKSERLQLIYQVDALTSQVNELEDRLAINPAGGNHAE